jgi:hypothetical protein
MCARVHLFPSQNVRNYNSGTSCSSDSFTNTKLLDHAGKVLQRDGPDRTEKRDTINASIQRPNELELLGLSSDMVEEGKVDTKACRVLRNRSVIPICLNFSCKGMLQ